MPIYEYQCTECGELKEALQKIGDAPLTDCPACGRATLRKHGARKMYRLSSWCEDSARGSSAREAAVISGRRPADGLRCRISSEHDKLKFTHTIFLLHII